jgi:hypothetical protein
MATGNPLAGMMARQLIQKLAGGGGAPGGAMPPGGGMPQPGGPGGPGAQGAPPDQAGMQIQTQLAELQGADPNSMLKLLQQIKSQLVAIYPRAAFTIPEVSRNVAQAQKYLDTAIKECEKAAATASTVQPIANNAGQPPRGQDDGAGLQQFAMGAQS